MIAFPPDITFVIQIASFFLLVVALRELLFAPVMRVLDERAARTIGARAEAERSTRASEDAARSYDQRLEAVRRELAVETDRARTAIAAEERAIVGAAQDQAASQLAERRTALKSQAAEARAALAREAETVAARMVERVVGRNAA